MATVEQQPSVPVETPAPSISAAPVASPSTSSTPVPSPTPVATEQSVPNIVQSIDPNKAYSAGNINSVINGGTPSIKNAKLSKLEKQINDAKSTAELNQVDLGNQTVAMGVISGEQAHNAGLFNARINALTNVYNTKLADEARKEAEAKDFTAKYGVDPKTRPKGMSKREFSASLMAGGKTPLQIAQKSAQMDLAIKQQQLANGGSGTGTGTWSATTDSDGNAILLNNKTGQIKPVGSVNTSNVQIPNSAALQSQILSNAGPQDHYANPNDYQAAKDAFLKTTSDPHASQAFDIQFSHLLNPKDAPNMGVTIVDPKQHASANVENWVQAVGMGNATMQQVPASLRNAVADGLNKSDTYGPLASSRMTMAANRIVSNFIALPQYQLTANGLPYLQRIDAAMKTPGSVSDQDLLDSLTKLNTAGNAITDAQVKLVTGGQSYSDMVSTFKNKFQNGGVLSDNQRQQIQEIAKNIYDNYKAGYQPVYDQAVAQLQASGIPKQYWTIPDLNNLNANGKDVTAQPDIFEANGTQYRRGTDGLYYAQ